MSANVSSDWQESGSAYTAKVGGIAGENNGTIEYCVVTGNVTNNDADNADNSEVLNKYDGKQMPAALTGRTLYKDGAWNTICLPFDLVLDGSPLEGATARPLTGASIGAQRAYFKIGDGALVRQLTALNLNFGDGDTEETTPITIQSGVGGEAWYTLDGRRLAGKPSRAGVYI